MSVNNVRIGYACINMTLSKKKVCCNKTCRLATAIKQGTETQTAQASQTYSQAIYDFLTDYCIRNLNSMYQILSWNRRNNIFFYRMSSDMFPHINNLKIKPHMTDQHWESYSSLEFAKLLLQEIGKYAQKYQIRLTMHPDHYNQLATKTESVLENTLSDLTYHGLILEYLYQGAELYNKHLQNTDRTPKENIMTHGVLCVHGGGTYNDKPAAIKRWKTNFKKLPKFVQKRIALENDERGYNVEDLLPTCNELKILLIFDFHHYN